MRKRGGTRLGYGFIDQGLSSATNFGLTILAARWLGATGLGEVSIGFTAYLFALVFVRSAVLQPLVVLSSVQDPQVRRRSTDSSLAITLLFGVVAGGLMAIVGVIVRGSFGRGLILFSPFMPAALLQDFWRLTLFRDQRGGAAALNDGIWAGVMLVLFPLAFHSRTDWAVVGEWGLGVCVAALFGFLQLDSRPARARQAITWWIHESLSFGIWWALDRVVYTAGTVGAVVVLAGILSAREIGGLRAVQSAMAPLTLLLPAVGLPGLPAISRALVSSVRVARSLALRLTLWVTLLATLYVGLFILARGRALSAIFGHAFESFGSLVLPMAIGQIALAAGSGFVLLVMAARLTRPLLAVHLISTGLSLPLAIVLGRSHGVVGAAWGLTIGAALSSTLTVLLTSRVNVVEQSSLVGIEVDG